MRSLDCSGPLQLSPSYRLVLLPMLSEKEYRQLAFLARLDPDDPALRNAYGEFNTILKYVDKIQGLDVKTAGQGKKPSVSRSSPLREDKAKGSELSHQAIARFAPQWEAGHFLVPGVIESEEH